MSAEDLRFYIAGCFTPIILLFVVAVYLSFSDWVKAKYRRWNASRYNSIYSRGYDAGKKDCEADK